VIYTAQRRALKRARIVACNRPTIIRHDAIGMLSVRSVDESQFTFGYENSMTFKLVLAIIEIK